MEFRTTVDGIPCICRVIAYAPAKPWKQHTFPGAGPGDCDPPEDEDFDYEILDRKGYPASWLERKLDHNDERRFIQEFKENLD